MVVVAQLVRASDCDSEGRGFEPHHPPKKIPQVLQDFFLKFPENFPEKGSLNSNVNAVHNFYQTFVNSNS